MRTSWQVSIVAQNIWAIPNKMTLLLI
jgi:hypothetical protein